MQDDEEQTAFDWPRPDDAWTVDMLGHAKRAVEDRMLILDEASASIGAQIAQAQQEKAESGVQADPDWWRRVNFAKRMKGRERQRCQHLLGEINKRLRNHNRAASDAEYQADVRKRFIVAAKATLPAATYEAIWARVNAEGQQIIKTPKEN